MIEGPSSCIWEQPSSFLFKFLLAQATGFLVYRHHNLIPQVKSTHTFLKLMDAVKIRTSLNSLICSIFILYFFRSTETVAL